MKQAELVYTPNEEAGIEVLKANRGTPLSAKKLGIAPAVLTSIARKCDRFPESPLAVKIHKEDFEETCPTCGAVHSYKVYFID